MRRAVVFAATTTVAIAGLLSAGLPAQAKPSAAELRAQISVENNKIEANGEKYNGAKVKLDADQKLSAKLVAKIGPAQLAAQVADRQLGTIAAQLYQAGPTHPMMALIDSSSMSTMLDELGALNAISHGRQAAIDDNAKKVQNYQDDKRKQDALIIKDRALIASLKSSKAAYEKQLTHLTALQDAENRATGGGGKSSGGGSSGGGSSGGGSSGGGSGASKFSHSYVTHGGHACPQTAGSGKGHIAAVKACSLIWPVHMYRLTSAGPTYYDCSGLTMVAWRAAGVTLNHFTGDQIKSSETGPVTGGLQVGDLVFYNGGGHVAIYVGNGWIVQAEHTGEPLKMSPVGFEKIYAERRPS